MKEIIVLFKTHLDVGYTDLAKNVVNQYMTRYIPAALDVAAETRERGDRFIWTLGSWLISKYLKEGERKEEMIEAIRNGDIRWHALPFTTHTEFMNEELFQFGLNISHSLDQQFGFQTIAAKMTDVPGHTRAMIPYLYRSGVRFLHIGVNPASTVPDVPDLFRWRSPDGEEIVVMYQNNYGTMSEIGKSGVAVCFAHTGDNRGPQSAEAIQSIYDELREKYPGVNVHAGTLEDVAQIAIKEEGLPVLTDEIGDSWIHGTGTDPQKVSQYRALLRMGSTLPAEEKQKLYEHLMMVPEHTWGYCTELWLGHLLKLEGSECKETGLDIPLENPEEIYTELSEFHRQENPCLIGEHDFYVRKDFEKVRASGKFACMEHSWQEQRDYITSGADALPKQKRIKAYEHISEYKRDEIDSERFTPIASLAKIAVNGYKVAVNENGAIVSLEKDGKMWADEAHKLGEFFYEVFSEKEVQRFAEQYVTSNAVWAIEEFQKIGMGAAIKKYASAKPQLTFLGVDQNQLLIRTEMHGDMHALYGAPAKQEILVTFEEDGVAFDFAWFDKPASRVAEGIWLGFHPTEEVTAVQKMGQWINPFQVVCGGNRKQHSVDCGVKFESLLIETLDTSLVNIGDPSLFQFSREVAASDDGIWFNLYNNMWNTNFPMWYDGDARFRFKILQSKKVNA